MFVDTHAHLTSSSLYENIEEVLERAKAAQITRINNIATSVDSLEKGLKLQEKYGWVYNTCATTPHDVDKWGDAHFDIIAEAAKNKILIAIGETGLDYHYEHSSKKNQLHFLEKYSQLAYNTSMPLIIHCREAFEDLFNALEQYVGPCVLHCFTGTFKEAQEVIRRGWYLSMSGIVTFKKAEELQQVAKWVPLGQLLIETDAPYLAPTPYRGKTNEPALLPYTAQFIAGLRGITVEELALATSTNANYLFKL